MFREQKINIKVPDGVSPEDAKIALEQCLLRPVEHNKYLDGLKFEKNVNDLLQAEQNNITMSQNKIKLLDQMLHPRVQAKRKRFNVVHRYVKNRLFYPLIKFFSKNMGKYIIKDINDIEPVWHNNFLRMYYHSFEVGLKDMWIYMHREMNQFKKSKFPGLSNYYENYVKTRYDKGNWGRQEIVNIWMTEVLEDSIDREWFNMSIMNLVHTAMEFYNISPDERKKVPRPNEFPVYKSSNEKNPEYFVKNMKYPVWQCPKPKTDQEYEKEVNTKNEKEMQERIKLEQDMKKKKQEQEQVKEMKYNDKNKERHKKG